MELDFILSKEEEKAAGRTELIYDLVIIGGEPAGMTAAVFGRGNSAFETALDLVKVAPKIYLVDIASTWGADSVLVEQIEKEKKVRFFPQCKIKDIKGDDRVESITIFNEMEANYRGR